VQCTLIRKRSNCSPPPVVHNTLMQIRPLSRTCWSKKKFRMIHHHWLVSFHNYSEIVGSHHTICDSIIAWSFTQVKIRFARAVKIEVSSHPFHWRLHFTNKIVVWTARKLILKPKIFNHIVYHTYLLQIVIPMNTTRSGLRLWFWQPPQYMSA
jgi:hypothetical protein